VVRWPRWCGLLPLVPLLVLAASALEPERRLVIALSPGQPALSAPFPLDGGSLGSPRIHLRASLPANSSLVLSAELLDPRGAVVLQLTQQAWRQSGSWYEEGQTGTWEEGETESHLSFRPQRSGSYRLRLSAEELSDGAGQPLQTPIVVQAGIRQHNVDAPLLWFTAAVTQAMAWILRASVYGGRRQRQVRRVSEGRVALRLTAGGAGLVRVQVEARYERPSGGRPPLGRRPTARLTLSVAGPCGEPLLEKQQNLATAAHSSDGDAWLTVRQIVHLRLPRSQSIRVRADLMERLGDGGGPWELEWLQLVIQDGVVSPGPVAALPLNPRLEGA
jgi:hypothetical protein